MQKIPTKLTVRYSILKILSIAFFILLLYRAFELAIYPPINFDHLPTNNATRRGIIFDTNNHELAVSRDSASIGMKPEDIIDEEKTSFLLAKILDIPRQKVSETIKSNKKFIYLKRKVSNTTAETVRQLKIQGVVIEKKNSRFYPNDHLASTVLGFVGVDNEGLAGIEYAFNEDLASNDTKAQFGHNVHLTISSFVQYQLEKSLHEAMQETNAKAAVGVITDVNSGQILALASLPDFNPNNALAYPAENRKNRGIIETYEPGSTFKIFTLAALMNEHLLDENKEYFCPGYFKYKEKTLVHCTHQHGNQNLGQILKTSCNTGIIQASWRLPISRFFENLKVFGFGSLTQIELPGEVRGFIPPPKNWDVYLKASIPIGHGLRITPIQLALSANAIANGGTLYQAMLVKKITNVDGEVVQQFEKKVRNKVTNIENSQLLLSYLQKVVSTGGTGAAADIPGFLIAGKTGTSKKSTSKGYLEGKYQASFLGFFPGDKPEISMLIWIDEPKGDLYQGGSIAAPVFRKVTQDVLAIIHKGKINELEDLAQIKINHSLQNKIMPNFIGFSKKALLFLLLKHFPNQYKINGEGYVHRQLPAPGSRLDKTQTLEFDLDFP